jgi:hypothetical protein
MVPFNATSGRITVTANGATATSAEDFIISTVGDAPVITSISPITGPFGTVVKISGAHLYPLPGQTNVRINGIEVIPTLLDDLQLTVTIPPYVGSGRISVTTAFGTAQSTDIFYVLPAGISPSSVILNTLIQPDSAPQQIGLAAGQYAVLFFDAGQGDYLSLQASAFSTANNMSYTVTSPTGTVIGSGNVSRTNPSIHLPRLNTAGSYSVLIGAGANAGQFTLAVERNVVIGLDGAPISISTAVPGQTRRLLFTATIDKYFGLGVSDLTLINGSYTYAYAYVYQPDGVTLIRSTNCFLSNGGCDASLSNLPATGTYSVVMRPVSTTDGTQMSFTATVSHDVALSLSPNSPQAVNLSRNGQRGRLTFTGTAGSTIALQIGGITTVPAGRILYLGVLRPDGTVLTSTTATSGTTFNLANLPTTGAYTLFIIPYYGATANLTATLTPSESVAVAADGVSTNVATTLGGQHAYFSFSGTAGENLGLGISNFVLSNTTYIYAYLTVYRPDGAVLVNAINCFASNGGCDASLSNLPATGTYSVVMRPVSTTDGTQMSFTATVSHDVALSLSPNSPQAVNLSRNGQRGRLTFTGTAGSTIALQIGGITTVPASRILYLGVLRPDGTVLTSTTATSGTTFNLANLPTTGAYTLFIIPYYGATANLTVTAQ